ncbi:MAG: flagellar biosynthetic protein FliO [Treponema sp.]|nr:flagellar biosynthetic protein FliO [Treponema sp.]
MGGEKLNIRYNVIAAALLLAVSFTFFSYPLSAQQNSSLTDSAGEESSTEPDSPRPPSVNPVINWQDTPSSSEQMPSSSIGLMIRMILVLALAALAIYGVVFFIKRLAKPALARDPHLKILAAAPLGTGAFAAVISVGARAWLVGGGDAGVSLIAEIDDQEALESMLIDEAGKSAEAQAGRFPDFRSFLRKFMKSGGGFKPGNPFDSHAENLRKQRDRLKGI